MAGRGFALLVVPRGPRRAFSEEHVLRQRQHDRSRAAAHRDVEGAREIFGNAVRIADLRRPFGERGEHRPEIDFLEGLAVQHGLIGLADEEDHRRGILKGRVHADGGVGGAGPAGDEADAGLARELAKGFGHIGRAALLTAGDEPDRIARVIERIERGQIGFAGHAEDMACAMDPERLDQGLATGAYGLGHRCVPFLPAWG